MASECCSAAGGTRPRRSTWAALVPAVALPVLPKCPLCIAGYLSLLGLSAGVAVTLARLVPAVLGIAALLGLPPSWCGGPGVARGPRW